MKPAVLNVNNFHYYRGGSDQYFLKLTMLLKEKGHRVTTFSTENTRNINKSWLAGEMPRSVDTEKFSSISNILRYCYSPEARKKMALALQEFRPDLVHLHIYYGQLTGSIIDPIKNAGIPIIQTLHEYKLVCPTHGLFAHNSFCDKCKGKHYWKAIIQRCNRNSIARTALSVTESYISEWLGVNKHIDRYIAVSQFQKNQLLHCLFVTHFIFRQFFRINSGIVFEQRLTKTTVRPFFGYSSPCAQAFPCHQVMQ